MVKELAGRLAALDPDAGAALRVISYFDQLREARVRWLNRLFNG